MPRSGVKRRHQLRLKTCIKGQKPRPSPTATPRPTSTQVNLSSSFNRTGIVADGTTFGGGLDADGYALSANLLGASVTFGSARFNLGPVGANDVVSAAGQTIALPSGSYGALTLLATGVNGNQAGQPFTVTYADGTKTTFTQSLSDWYTPQNYSGESTAVTMSYRDLYNGTKDSRTFYVYVYSFSLNATKTVSSITLPNDANVEVLAIDLLPTGTPMPTVTPTATQRPTPTATPNPTASPQPTGGLPAPIAGTNYKLVWSDEFNGTELNANNWTVNPWGNSHFGSNSPGFSYSASNVSVNDGILTIKAVNTSGGYAGNWTGAGMSTQNNPALWWKYGFFEALIELPAYGPGFWPGFWMFQSTNSTELDICEYPNQSPGRVDQSMHTASGDTNIQWVTVPNPSTEYHLFQMLWTPTEVNFYVDNVLTGVSNTADIPSTPCCILLGFDVCATSQAGGWCGPTNSTTPSSAYFKIAYVRVYQQS